MAAISNRYAARLLFQRAEQTERRLCLYNQPRLLTVRPRAERPVLAHADGASLP
jgi:hypothetical protein